MKCKVFAATTRSTQNMRQMTMEREVPSGESHVVLDVKYCGVLYITNRVGVFLSLFFCISLSSASREFFPAMMTKNFNTVTRLLKLAVEARL